MTVDQSGSVGAKPATVCSACGAAIASDHQLVDTYGRAFCQSCYDAQEPLVELQVDADAPPAAFQCSVCRSRFSAEKVYELDGTFTCTECWDRTHALEAGAETVATNGVRAARTPPPRPREKVPPRPALLSRVTCPHCWNKFPPHDILWVSRHADLIGDPVAGPDSALRFLPSQFSADGAARDPRGMICQALACPNCHLIIPRPIIEAEPLFASIIGVASAGKSYFLTAMAWELRRILSLHFGVSFNDADPSFNRTLNQFEETLFLPGDPDRPVKLDKTDTVGSLMYDQIRLGQQIVSLPRPFLFTMRPSGKHPNAKWAAHLARVVCLYDNAGEHFNPDEDTASSPVTQHLGTSRVLMFLYDPTQDPRFRARCRGLSADPQLEGQSPTRRQETILIETAARVRRFSGLRATDPVNRPMLVIVPKADVWGRLISLDLSTEPIVPGCVANNTLDGVDFDRIESVSAIVRGMLLQIAPEFVTTAEEFSSNVVYIPVSALGTSPEVIPGREGLWIRPGQIKPQWVTVPFLYMFAKWSHDLIGGVRHVKVK